MLDFVVLGVPLRVHCDDRRVRSTLSERLFAGTGEHEDSMALQVELASGIHSAHPGRPSFTARAGRFEIETPAGRGWADQALGKGSAQLYGHEDSCFEEQATLLETLAIFLAYSRRPIVLHAAAIVHNDSCVLLTGAEGAGKTTLTYEALRSGVKILSDDLVYFSGTYSQTAWGHPTSLYLMPDAIRLFPELLGCRLSRRLNGEEKIRIPLLRKYPDLVVSSHTVDGVVTLERGADSHSSLERAEREDIVGALTGIQGDPPLDALANAEMAGYLACLPHANLRVGRDLGLAVELLQVWIDQLTATCT